MHAFILMRNLFTNLTVCEVFFILFFLLENVEDEGNKYSLANGREGRKGCMVLTNDEDLRSRARATELVGIVAMSVGRVRMEPILPPYIEAAISVIALSLNSVTDCAICLRPGII